jgi:hypothetical protein
MNAGSFDKMTGEVEADETFIGGLGRFMHKDQKAKITGTGGAGKVAVMGLNGTGQTNTAASGQRLSVTSSAIRFRKKFAITLNLDRR